MLNGRVAEKKKINKEKYPKRKGLYLFLMKVIFLSRVFNTPRKRNTVQGLALETIGQSKIHFITKISEYYLSMVVLNKDN